MLPPLQWEQSDQRQNKYKGCLRFEGVLADRSLAQPNLRQGSELKFKI